MAVLKRGKQWYITYYIKRNGKRQFRMEVVGPRKDQAETRFKEYQEMIREGIDPRSRGETPDSVTLSELPPMPASVSKEILTLKQFASIFLELHGNNQSVSMQESYKTSFGHLMPVFGKEKIDSITKIMMQTYMASRKRDKASNATVNREIACMKVVLSQAELWEYIPKNFLHGLKLLKEAPIRERYLTSDEAQRLILSAPSYLRDIIVLALATGMRQNEIFSLKWESIILNERFRHGEITIVGKGGKRRNIRMNQTVYDLLARKRRENTGEYVFVSPKTGEKLNNVKRSFATALKKAGISSFRFHDLRHTSASWMVQGGGRYLRGAKNSWTR